MKKYYGFTLAEIVISVCIIIFVIQITYTLTNRTDKYARKISLLKMAHNILSEVVRDQNYIKPVSKWGWDGIDSDKASNYILNKYFLSSLNDVTTCNNPLNCVGGFTSMDGDDYTNFRQETRFARAVIGKEKFHIALAVKGKCRHGDLKSLCGYIYVDIDNKDGANKLGDDVFVFGVYGSGNVMPYGYDFSEDKINKGCNKDSYGDTCAARIMKNDWQIDYEIGKSSEE